MESAHVLETGENKPQGALFQYSELPIVPNICGLGYLSFPILIDWYLYTSFPPFTHDFDLSMILFPLSVLCLFSLLGTRN